MTKYAKDNFLDNYNNSNNKPELRKESLTYFDNKYYKNPFTPEWIFDQEERKLAKKLNFFIPGRIYSFRYTPHSIDELDYYDLRPMIYVIGEFISESTGWRILQGVNLNFFPEKAKVLFLNSVFNVFGPVYERAEKISEMDRLSFMPEIQKFLTNWQFMKTAFDTRSRIGIDFAVRNYDMSIITNAVLIETDDYEMIPYYVTKELRGKPPAYIYKLYNQERNALANKKSASKNKIPYKKR